MAEMPEDQRAALVDRIALLIADGTSDADADRIAIMADASVHQETAEAVLSLLESGRAGVWLVPAAGVLDTVGVIIRQLRDAKTALLEARAEIERLRAQVADLLPYAWAGADALEVWEPYGPDWEGPHGEDPWRGDPARTMLDRITAGEFGEVPS